MADGRDAESDGANSGGRRWRPIRDDRVEVTPLAEEVSSTTTSRQPPPDSPFRSMPRSLLTYATPGRAASTRYASTRRTPGSPWPLSFYLCPLPLGFQHGNRVVRGRWPRIRVFHARRVTAEEKVCPIRRGRETSCNWRWGGDVARTKGGSEVFAGERGMRGSVSACT